jgi:hypothetical protein
MGAPRAAERHIIFRHGSSGHRRAPLAGARMVSLIRNDVQMVRFRRPHGVDWSVGAETLASAPRKWSNSAERGARRLDRRPVARCPPLVRRCNRVRRQPDVDGLGLVQPPNVGAMDRGRSRVHGSTVDLLDFDDAGRQRQRNGIYQAGTSPRHNRSISLGAGIHCIRRGSRFLSALRLWRRTGSYSCRRWPR